ncbi:unnamed protein product [Merluccius merluccius]
MGENLFQSASPFNWDSVITAWHNEVRNYKYPEGSINGKAVVWNSSYQVGCGVTKCGSVYLYGCHYYRAYLNCPALKQKAGCGNSFVSAWCPAECKCSDEIIPIYRK